MQDEPMQDLALLSADDLTALSRQLEAGQRYGELEAVLRKLLVMRPGAAEHAMRLGWALLSLNRPDEAFPVFSPLADPASPDRPSAAWGAGIAAYRAGDAPGAVRYLTIAFKGGVAAAGVALVKAANTVGQPEKGLEVTSRLAAQMPLDRDTIILHARQLAYMAEYRRAADAILHLFAKKAADSESMELLCQVLMAAKNYRGANNALAQLLRIDFERGEMQALWTHCLAEGYRAAQAEAMLGEIVVKDPAHCAAIYQLALLAERRSDLALALALTERCAGIKPDSLIIAGLRGRLELLLGDEVGAAGRLRELWRSVAKVVEAREKRRVPLSPPPPSANALTPSIYIPVEVSSRELLSRLLIALFAARSGFDIVVLGHTVLRQATHLPRGVILNKTLHAMDDVLMAEARARGHVFCAIDEEAFGWTAGVNSLLRTLDPTLLPSCAALFAPGRYYVDEVSAVAPGASLIAAGNPRTDFFDPRLSGLAADEARALRERQGRSIVVCTNFGGWNSRSHLHDAVCSIAFRASGAALGSARGKYLQDVYEDSAAVECRNTVGIREALPVLARAFPGHTIILRPHPGENSEAWERMLAGVEGVVVSGSEPLHVQMLASDLLIHLAGCGTGLEARLAGRPAVCFNPVTTFAYPRLGISTQLSPNAYNVEELVHLVKEVLERGAPPLTAAQEGLLALHIERPAELASAVIAGHLAMLFTQITGCTPGGEGAVQADLQELRARLTAAKTKADAIAFSNVGLRTKRLTVSANDISGTLERFGACLGFKERFSVSRLAEGAFFIRRKP